MISQDEIEHKFTYHPPKGNQAERYEKIRQKAKELSILINESCPESDDKKFALHYINIGVMSANASIARNE